MQGKITKILRVDVDKGCIVQVEGLNGLQYYLTLHKDWILDFHVSKGNCLRIASIQGIGQFPLYPHSGPARKQLIPQEDK